MGWWSGGGVGVLRESPGFCCAIMCWKKIKREKKKKKKKKM